MSKGMNTVAIGDNYDFLIKSADKYDIIYIDPPYNTGNKFSYHDNRTTDDWSEFMLERLEPAKAIMKEDGVIFVSIDDNSLYELKFACDKIFGRNNFLGIFITKQAVRSNSKFINTIHEYVISYAKDKSKLREFKIKRTDNPADSPMIKDLTRKVKKELKTNGQKSAEKLLRTLSQIYMDKRGDTWLRNYSEVDSKGNIFFPKDLSVPGKPAELVVEEISLKLPALATRKWSSPKKLIKLHSEDKLHFKSGRPYEKHYLADSYDNVSSVLDFYSRQGTNDLNKLGLRGLFDTPKPVELIKYLVRIATYGKDDALILDFFAGSGTTGQAVMEVNLEDKKNHVFHLVQLPEKVSRDSEQYQFATINNIKPAVDQLMIHRLSTAKAKLNYEADFKITKVGKV